MEKNQITGNNVVREFKLTTLALKNRNTVLLLTFLLAVFGIMAYNTMPIQLFPDINMPQIYVTTVYPGNAPADIENLITRPLEKEIHSISGIKEMKSISLQDNSFITVEFNSDVDIKVALQDVKDAVDKAKSELPDDLDMDPLVTDVDVNEIPIIDINLSGDFSKVELKEFAEYLEDELEAIPEISKVDIKGLDAREIQINVDPYKLESFEIGFQDIEDAVRFENVSISGGDLIINKTTRSIRTMGEFTSIDEIKNIIVKNEDNNRVYLWQVAEIKDGFEDPLTYARLNRNPVVSLSVVKKSGENLIDATNNIFMKLARAKKSGALPKNLEINLFNDQSKYVRDMVDNLENSIIMGVIFVVLVLFFFLGLRNALFVGLAIPMSTFISFVVLGLGGSTVNMMVLFSLVLALGMLVDNAIVAVENIYRFVHEGHSFFEAAKTAVGEIAVPIIASTATTLAAFFPLVFWKGLVGEFMKTLPITLIIVLTASLFVALVIIPVLCANFFKKDEDLRTPTLKRSATIGGIIGAAALLFYGIGANSLGTLLVFLAIVVILNFLFLHRASEWFQKVFLVKMEHGYLKLLKKVLKGKGPVFIVVGTFVLMIAVMQFFQLRKPPVVFFPVNEPNLVMVYSELPIGSDITATNTHQRKLEDTIFEIIKPYQEQGVIEQVLTTVGKGVQEPDEFFPIGNRPNKAVTTIKFVDYDERGGASTSEIMKKITGRLLGKYPGIKISVVKDSMGPPTGRPISLEVRGKDFDKLIGVARSVQAHLEKAKIPGVEQIKMDLSLDMPELLVKIDRNKARWFGLSTAQVASTIRTALFGKEVSDYKEGEDDYPIMIRMDPKYRNDVTALMNQRITFKSQTTGNVVQVPISAVATFKHSNTYGSVNRVDMDKAITLWSNVIEGYNPSEINIQIAKQMETYDMPEGYEFRFTGEQQEQAETSAFMMRALLIAIALIMMILVTQFNSFAKPLIILASIVFSTIGVFGGIATFRMDFVVIMTGIGIISLAGVVVNNAIVLIDYIDFLKTKAKKKFGLDPDDHLPIKEATTCIVQGGRTRLRPVLLTAITTILGLIPMAVGLNINFATLLSDLDPQIYFGGDNALFWGPMAWTVIFGLAFATFLTLVVVPAMYLIGNKIKVGFIRRFRKDIIIMEET